jgi:cold shock CspA family protein
LDGTVDWFDSDKRHGRILGSDGQEYFVHQRFLDASTGPEALVPGARVAFVAVEHNRKLQAREVRVLVPDSDGSRMKDAEHSTHCFVVMPFGRDSRETRWFRGWYETVIQPAVVESGYAPILSASEKAPNAINDEIRAHLALDPMVVVDLGGMAPDDPPNPNVMYELGIRHALNLPLVMMGWGTQRLPFDISNQRVIMGRRELLDIEPTKDQLTSFIAAAKSGQFYRPMEAVGRIATIDRAAESLGGESFLGVLAKEVRELRRTVAQGGAYGERTVRTSASGRSNKMKSLLSSSERSRLYLVHSEAGGNTASWSKFLDTSIASFGPEDPRQWTLEDWDKVVVDAASGMSPDDMTGPAEDNTSQVRGEEMSPNPPVDVATLGDQDSGDLPLAEPDDQEGQDQERTLESDRPVKPSS